MEREGLLPLVARIVSAHVAANDVGADQLPGMIADVHGITPHSFPKAALHKRGVTGWVEHPGEIKPGDTVEIRV